MGFLHRTVVGGTPECRGWPALHSYRGYELWRKVTWKSCPETFPKTVLTQFFADLRGPFSDHHIISKSSRVGTFVFTVSFHVKRQAHAAVMRVMPPAFHSSPSAMDRHRPPTDELGSRIFRVLRSFESQAPIKLPKTGRKILHIIIIFHMGHTIGLSLFIMVGVYPVHCL